MTAHYHHYYNRKKLYRRLAIAFLGLIATVLFIILLVWLILRPTKPHFVLKDATVSAFNLSSSNLLTSNLQVTLSSRNPNDKIGIYYDRLDVYAAYRGLQITLPVALPASYQGHKDTAVWSPFLYGTAIPVAPYLAVMLNKDQWTGTVLIDVRVDGRIRWKVGTFVSGNYHLHVNCQAYINFGNQNTVVVGSVVNYQQILDCHAEV